MAWLCPPLSAVSALSTGGCTESNRSPRWLLSSFPCVWPGPNRTPPSPGSCVPPSSPSGGHLFQRWRPCCAWCWWNRCELSPDFHSPVMTHHPLLNDPEEMYGPVTTFVFFFWSSILCHCFFSPLEVAVVLISDSLCRMYSIMLLLISKYCLRAIQQISHQKMTSK